ncbi:hypothetical protein ABIE27_001975 [Paenibacillus sp. 4624]|uniref:hypothetical protein n=1 Tax=Paenibacillus sp. 4624 TaxID=3156453 RepID=UPI003D1B5FFA
MSDTMIRKTQGEYPLDVVVMDETVHFDKRGVAEVDEITGEVLLSIPGYEIYEEKTNPSNSQQPGKDKNTPDPDKEKKDTAKGKQTATPADTPTATE